MESIRRQQKEQDKPIFPSSGFEFRVRLKHIHLKLEEKRRKWRWEERYGKLNDKCRSPWPISSIIAKERRVRNTKPKMILNSKKDHKIGWKFQGAGQTRLAYQFTKQFQKVLTKINVFLKEVNKSNTTKQMRTEKTGSKETHGDFANKKKRKIGC